MLGEIVASLVLLIFPAALVWAAVSDFLTMTIPNRLSVGLAGSFFLLAPLLGLPFVHIGLSLAAAGAVFLVCFALFAANVMGGGDAKILTAASLWFGLTPALLGFLISVAYAGGIVTLLFLLLRSRAVTAMAKGLPLPASMTGPKKIPYGIAIAIGGLMTFLNSPLATKALEAF